MPTGLAVAEDAESCATGFLSRLAPSEMLEPGAAPGQHMVWRRQAQLGGGYPDTQGGAEGPSPPLKRLSQLLSRRQSLDRSWLSPEGLAPAMNDGR